MGNLKYSILTFFIFASASISTAEDNDNKGLDINGRIINDNIINQYYSYDSNNTTFAYAGENTLRLNLLNRDRSSAKIEGSLDVNLFYGEYADSYMAQYGTALPALFSSGNQTAIMFNLRKLYLELYPDFADITLGRQIINFGVGELFSPINVFSAIDLSDINFTRNGSDIAEIKVPFNSTAGLDLVTSLTSHLSNNTSAVKLFANISGYDLSAIGIYRGAGNEAIAGLTFKGDIEIGIHGEAVEHFFNDNISNYFEGMLGADYSFFDSKLIFLLEYYYNEKPIDPDQVTPGNISTINRLFYNRHYLFFLSQYQIDEIQQASLSVIYNPLQPATFLTAQYFRNIFQNVNMTAYLRYYDNNIDGLTWVISPKLEYAIRFEVLF